MHDILDIKRSKFLMFFFIVTASALNSEVYTTATSCTQCQSTCASVPIDYGEADCFEGPKAEMQLLIQSGNLENRSIECDVCSTFGYPFYLIPYPNPLYPDVTVWSSASRSPTMGPIVPITVDVFNSSYYLGNWFQMYSNLFVSQTIEKDGFCITAQYGERSDGNISVHNYQTLYEPNGTAVTADGFAFTPSASFPGQLTVRFDNASDTYGNNFEYWIIELGPVIRGQYEYSIVTDSMLQTLFVLARNVEEFKLRYNRDVQDTLKYYGFQGIPTYQALDCDYNFDLGDDDDATDQSSGSDQPSFSSADVVAVCLGVVAVAFVASGVIYYTRRAKQAKAARKTGTLLSSGV